MSERRLWLVVAVTAIASHAAALFAGFIWLDHAHIEEGLALARGDGFWNLFASGFAGTGFYRPMMAVSLSIDAALGGAPWLYHATTIAWHAAASVLVVVAAGAMGLSRRAATLAGCLFAVHPATSLVADAIAFRSESMSAVALLSLVVFHRRKMPWAAAAALLFGALTKETALVLGPLFILALELDPGAVELRGSAGEREPFDRKKTWAIEGAAFAIAGAFRWTFAPRWRARMPELALDEAIGTRLASIAKSTARIFVPVDGTVCDAFDTSSTFGPRALAGAALAAAVVYLAYRRRGPAVLLALSLLPSLHLVPIMRFWSPHYLYVPLAFAAMLLSEAVDRRGTTAVRVAFSAAAVLFAITFRDGLRYRNDESFFGPEVAADPHCREAHFYLGEAAREDRRLDEAAVHYQRALTPLAGVLSYVDRGAALQNLGVLQLQQEKFEDACATFRTALAADVDENERRKLTHNLATAELRSGNATEAARLLESEVERPDAMPASIFIRARAVRELGRGDEADALFRRLKAMAPASSR